MNEMWRIFRQYGRNVIEERKKEEKEEEEEKKNEQTWDRRKLVVWRK